MNKLGASLFIHNGLKYDYCLKESIESVLEVCDEVVVLEADSEDGTLDFLHKMAKHESKLKIYDHGIWECAKDFSRLQILANQAMELLATEWHFMIQADEVLHENSYDAIRKAIANKEGFDRFSCRRVNLFKDFNHYMRFDIENIRKPCSDVVIRLGTKNVKTHGDAESLLASPNLSNQYLSDIILFHYGMVRKRDILLNKAIAMQGWFFSNRGIDPQLLEMKEKYGEIRPEEIKGEDDLDILRWEHPKVAYNWVKERETILNEGNTNEKRI